MYQLETEELMTVLRALYWYEDKLTNTSDDCNNPDEWDKVVWLRRQLANELKNKAYIK